MSIVSFLPDHIPESKLPKELHSSWQKDGWLHNPDTGVFLEPGGQKLWFDTEASTREGFAAKMVSSDSTYSVHFEDSLAGSVGLYDTVIYGHIRECLCSIYAQAREYQELYEAWSKRTKGPQGLERVRYESRYARYAFSMNHESNRNWIV